MMPNKILQFFLIIWSVLVVLMAIFAQDYSSSQDMRINLSVAILLSSQECPALNWQEGFWNTHIPTNNFLPVYFPPERSAEYWVGWALAEYQWITCKRFKSIFSRISFSEIRAMYRVYHEMDIIHFIEDMDTRYREVEKEPQLKVIRESHGLSQRELAELSGVKLRSIQMYEQKVNNIDKAQAGTVYKLSRVLGCTVEDLLENPEM